MSRLYLGFYRSSPARIHAGKQQEVREREDAIVTIQAIERSPLHDSTHNGLAENSQFLGTTSGTTRMSTATTLAVTTRPMIEDDAMLLFELYASARAEELSRSGWATPQQRSFFRMQAQNQEQFFCRHHANLDRRTICINGFSAGRVLVDRGPDCFTIVDFGMLPSFRSRGIGTMVIAAVLADAAEAGVPVEMEIHRANVALRLARRLGFEVAHDDGDRVLLRWTPATVPTTRRPLTSIAAV